jgi:hypothetical protein
MRMGCYRPQRRREYLFLYSFTLFSLLTERRSSDRRSPTADQLFANADLKIGVPNSLFGYSVPSSYRQTLDMLGSQKQMNSCHFSLSNLVEIPTCAR